MAKISRFGPRQPYVFGLGCALVLVVELWISWTGGHHRVEEGISDLVCALIPLLAIGLFVRSTQPRSPFCPGMNVRRWAALALTGAAMAFTLRELVWCYYELALGRPRPVVSPADALSLMAHLLLVTGLFLLPSRRFSRTLRMRTALDALLVLVAAGAFLWYFVVGPQLISAPSDALGRFAATGYPVAEVLAVGALLGFWMAAGDEETRRILPVLGAGIGLILATDATYGYSILHATHVGGGFFAPVRAAGWVLVVQAARSISIGRPQLNSRLDQANLDTRSQLMWRSFLPYVILPLMLMLVVYVAEQRGNETLEHGVYVAAGIFAVLALLREGAVLTENLEGAERLRMAWQTEAQEEALRQSEARFRTLIEDMDVGVVLLGAGGELLVRNAAARDLLHGEADLDFQLGEQVIYSRAAGLPLNASPISYALQTGKPARNVVLALGRSGGQQCWCLLNAVPHHTPDGALQHVICTFTDITERQRAEEALRVSEERFRAVFELAPIGIEIADMEGHFLETNRAAQEMLGYSGEELRGKLWSDITHPDDIGQEDELDELLVRGEINHYQIEKRHIRKDGQAIWTRQTVAEMRDETGEPVFGIAMVENIEEKKRAEEALAYQAMHDALTALPNRTLLHDRLGQAIRSANRTGGSVALLLMDLDRFKDVNDTFGHHYGDLLLREVGGRLAHILRSADTVARLGGDEFALVLPEADSEGAIQAARKVLDALNGPLILEGQHFDIGASIGIALYPQHGRDAHTLLRRADVAMYAAKRGSTDFAVYEPTQDDHSPEKLALVADLRAAIERDELVLHYQPKTNLETGRTGHVEALVRWQHPQRGWVRPDEFIPLAEHTGLIKQLTVWVLDHALRQSSVWSRLGLDIGVSVNLSARNLHDPSLVETMVDLLELHGVEPCTLEIEITESAVMADPGRAMEILSHLHGQGIGIAIDDFGTGYSSLGYLRRLPVDQVKIDKSFVLDMGRDSDAAVIVRSVLDLGHNLGLEVVAEGVEDQETMLLLRSMGCDYAQGYFLSRPLGPDDLVAWLRRSNLRLADVS